MSITDIYEAFELIDDWEERYRYLIDLGRGLEPLSEEEKREEDRVHGCTSRVWMVTEVSGDPPVLTIRADSDAFIVKGLIALLLEVYSGRRVEEVGDIDIREIMGRLGLEKHLSPMRTNGIYAMVQEIQRRAAEAMAEG